MKKMKKLLSIAASAVLTAASAVSVCANASDGWIDDINVTDIGFEYVEDHDTRGIFRSEGFGVIYNEYTRAFRRFIKGAVEYNFYFRSPDSIFISMSCPDGESTAKDISSRIKTILPGTNVNISSIGETGQIFDLRLNAYDTSLSGKLSDEEHFALGIGYDKVKQIRDILMETDTIELDSFTLRNHNYQYVNISMDLPAWYRVNDRELEVLEAYMEENDLGFTVETEFIETKNKVDHYYAAITPDPEVPLPQVFEVLDRLAVEEDIRPWNVIAPAMYFGTGKEIDVLGSVDGDSNADGKLDIADAVLIMQSISNPDKYALSVQGSFNADIAGDGITMGDALAVQEMLLGSS